MSARVVIVCMCLLSLLLHVQEAHAQPYTAKEKQAAQRMLAQIKEALLPYRKPLLAMTKVMPSDEVLVIAQLAHNREAIAASALWMRKESIDTILDHMRSTLRTFVEQLVIDCESIPPRIRVGFIANALRDYMEKAMSGDVPVNARPPSRAEIALADQQVEMILKRLPHISFSEEELIAGQVAWNRETKTTVFPRGKIKDFIMGLNAEVDQTLEGHPTPPVVLLKLYDMQLYRFMEDVLRGLRPNRTPSSKLKSSPSSSGPLPPPSSSTSPPPPSGLSAATSTLSGASSTPLIGPVTTTASGPSSSSLSPPSPSFSSRPCPGLDHVREVALSDLAGRCKCKRDLVGCKGHACEEEMSVCNSMTDLLFYGYTGVMGDHLKPQMNALADVTVHVVPHTKEMPDWDLSSASVRLPPGAGVPTESMFLSMFHDPEPPLPRVWKVYVGLEMKDNNCGQHHWFTLVQTAAGSSSSSSSSASSPSDMCLLQSYAFNHGLRWFAYSMGQFIGVGDAKTEQHDNLGTMPKKFQIAESMGAFTGGRMVSSVEILTRVHKLFDPATCKENFQQLFGCPLLLAGNRVSVLRAWVAPMALTSKKEFPAFQELHTLAKSSHSCPHGKAPSPYLLSSSFPTSPLPPTTASATPLSAASSSPLPSPTTASKGPVASAKSTGVPISKGPSPSVPSITPPTPTTDPTKKQQGFLKP